MRTRELAFVASLIRLRQSAGMTQTDIARSMAAGGHLWHQQTVQRIEGMSRPVRLDEAFDLAEVLGSTVMAMVDATEVDAFIAAAESGRRTAAAELRAVADRLDP